MVTSVVLVGALLGAFLTSSLADSLLGRADGDNPTLAGDSSAPSVTRGPTESSGSTTTASGRQAQRAVGIVRSVLLRCGKNTTLVPEGVANLTYETVPADSPTRFYVTVAKAPATTATWFVDVGTGDITGADPLATDIVSGCPPS